MPNQDDAPASRAMSPHETGRPLGSRYILAEQLGSGAMGRVYRAVVRDGGGDVAVKLLRSDLSADHDVVTRFVRERQLLRSVTHPNVVQVLDLVAEADDLAIVMQYVPGGDMFHSFRGAVPGPQTMRMMAQVADGLLAIHTAGLVHRDLKPSNVLVEQEPDGHHRLRLTDFGVAEIIAGGQAGIFGTPGYMAPEVGEGRQATPAADVYALGVMIFELLTGSAPYKAENQIGLLLAHARSPLPRPAALPDPVWQLLQQMLAKNPEHRPDAEQVGTDLRRLTTQIPPGPFPVNVAPSVIDLTASVPVPVSIDLTTLSQSAAVVASSSETVPQAAVGAARADVAALAYAHRPADTGDSLFAPATSMMASPTSLAASPFAPPAPMPPIPAGPVGSPGGARPVSGTDSTLIWSPAAPAAGVGAVGYGAQPAPTSFDGAPGYPGGFRPDGPTMGALPPPNDDSNRGRRSSRALIVGMIAALAAIVVGATALLMLRQPETTLSAEPSTTPTPARSTAPALLPAATPEVSASPSGSPSPGSSLGSVGPGASGRPVASGSAPLASAGNAGQGSEVTAPGAGSVSPDIAPATSTLAVTDVSTTSATLQLRGVAAGTGGLASVEIKGLASAPTITPGGDSYTIPLTGLVPATKYSNLTAVVCNTANLCTGSNSIEFTTGETPPVAPTAGTLKVVGTPTQTDVDLRLSGVAANSGTVATIKVSGAGVSGAIAAGDGTGSNYSGSLTGLKEGTKYSVTAEVCNSAGLCDTSNAASFTTAEAAKPPTTPLVTVGTETTTTVPVAVSRVAPVSGDLKSLTVSVGTTDVVVPVGAASTYRTTVEGLTPGTTYTVTATTCNTLGLCATSAPVTAKTMAPPALDPGQVTLTPSAGPLGVVVSWTAATGGTGQVTCTVAVDASPNETGLPSKSVGVTAGSVSFTGTSGSGYVATKTCSAPGGTPVKDVSPTLRLP